MFINSYLPFIRINHIIHIISQFIQEHKHKKYGSGEHK
jgi:hypothetical protein